MIHILILQLFFWTFVVSRVQSFVFVSHAGKATNDFKHDKFTTNKHEEEKRLFAQSLSKSVLQPAEVLATSTVASPATSATLSVLFAKVRYLLINMISTS